MRANSKNIFAPVKPKHINKLFLCVSVIFSKMGSKRCHDVKEETCLGSQLGSGPGTGNSGSGFYNVNDYREILRYAEERHVEVIPEFDMPGHGHAAIKAMQARQKKFAAGGQDNEANKYLLSDPLDTSKYLSVQFFTDNAINPCLESTYEFLELVVSSVKHMHHDIQPLKVSVEKEKKQLSDPVEITEQMKYDIYIRVMGS